MRREGGCAFLSRDGDDFRQKEGFGDIGHEGKHKAAVQEKGAMIVFGMAGIEEAKRMPGLGQMGDIGVKFDEKLPGVAAKTKPLGLEGAFLGAPDKIGHEGWVWGAQGGLGFLQAKKIFHKSSASRLDPLDIAA